MCNLKSIVLGLFISMVISCGPVVMTVLAGNLDDPGSPASPISAMYTLEDIYNRLNIGTASSKRTGAFTEPSSGPTAGTGRTLDEVMAKAPSVDDANGAGVAEVLVGKTFWGLTSGAWGTKTGTYPPAGVAKTGQTPTVPLSAPTGSDGALQKGVAWPTPRFTGNSDGTVTDNLTGLIWLKDADCFGARDWNTALSDCNDLANGLCGLSDGSSAGEWRLPNVKELQSLIDFAYDDLALSNAAGTGPWTSGDAFTNVWSGNYWSGTSTAVNTNRAWVVGLRNGGVTGVTKGSYFSVWPVRGGQ